MEKEKCNHEKVILSNKSIGNNLYFIVSCHYCDKEFVSLPEKNRQIINISKY